MLLLTVLAAAATAAASAQAPAAPEKLICRTYTVTGSLARTKRVCMTKEDWARTADAGQSFGRDLVDGMRTRCGQESCS